MKRLPAALIGLMAAVYLFGSADVLHAEAFRMVSKEVGEAIQQEQQAAALAAQGKIAEAEALYKQSLATVERSLPNDPILAGSLNNVAQFYRAQKRFPEAQELFKRAVAIYAVAYGDNHTLTATALNNLASTYLTQGKANLAEPLLQRCLAATEKLLGPDHYAVAISLDWLGQAKFFQHNYVEAEAYLRRGLAIAEKSRETNSPLVVRILNHLIPVVSEQESKVLWVRSKQIIAKNPAAEREALPPVITLR